MAGLFVAVGQNGQRLISENGIDWKESQVGKEGETWRVIAFGGGRFVAAGSFGGTNIFGATSDGVSWEFSKHEGNYSRYVRGIIFHDGKFIALGGDPGSVGFAKPFALISADGRSWGELIELPGKFILRRFAVGKGLIVGVGDRGRRAVSPDGREWKDAADVKAIDTLVDVAFGAEKFVGVGLNGLRMTSEDGLTWINKQLGEEGEHLNSVLWTGTKFVAIGAGATFSSTDGWSWQRTANADAPLTVAYGAGIFVGTTWRGRILHSTDAVAWKEVFKCSNNLEAIGFGSA
ncbi:MAG: hypothetical protein QOE70_3233 [Chthoniobacter sp.]|jgi:hypothetical protein|nr:hypothetical protein [Chthoniobacter sp.]